MVISMMVGKTVRAAAIVTGHKGCVRTIAVGRPTKDQTRAARAV